MATLVVGVLAGPAWAPSTIDSRAIRITANTAAGTPVKQTDISLEVRMTSDGIENRLSESAPSDTGDRSVTTVVLRDAAGSPLGLFSVGLVARSRLADGLVSETTVDSSLAPPSSGRAFQVRSPEVRWRRLWHGKVKDAAGNVVAVDDVFLDLRFRPLAPGLVVAQTALVQSNDTLSIQYALGGDVDGDGVPDIIVASGTATGTVILRGDNTYTGVVTAHDSSGP
jgi:hypothetical protein